MTHPAHSHQPLASRNAMRTGFTISAGLAIPVVSPSFQAARRGQLGMRASGIGGATTGAEAGLLPNRPASRTT